MDMGGASFQKVSSTYARKDMASFPCWFESTIFVSFVQVLSSSQPVLTTDTRCNNFAPGVVNSSGLYILASIFPSNASHKFLFPHSHGANSLRSMLPDTVSPVCRRQSAIVVSLGLKPIIPDSLLQTSCTTTPQDDHNSTQIWLGTSGIFQKTVASAAC